MSDNTGMVYDSSPLPPAKPGGPPTEVVADRAIRTDSDGKLNYDSASAEGMVEIVLPALPNSPTSETRMLAKDFGPFVAEKIASSFARPSYIKTGAVQSPFVTFSHFIGCAEGSGLLDRAAIGRMKTLAREFEGEAEPREYFEQVLRPYLHSLAPQRR